MYSERVRSIQARATEAPTELVALDGRIERLRERLKRGDPDMAADDIQAAIDRALTKLHELTNTPPTMKDGARVFAAMLNAAERFRRQIAKGLDGLRLKRWRLGRSRVVFWAISGWSQGRTAAYGHGLRSAAGKR